MSNSTPTSFETVIGLEVHLQFNTKTKIFCGCANVFGREPNHQTCPVCLGLPGTLPVLNKQVLLHAIKVALALNCEVSPYIKFDRKNYYYPDLPKGYQISQYDFPIARNGFIKVTRQDNSTQKIRIHRAHLEEDAGKLIHDAHSNASLVDYNRTGTPLMEIVTEPDLHSPQEAYDYLHTLKLILTYLDVSDCDMEKGSLRCDANVSIRKKGETRLGTKTELKNMNSFKAVKTALEYEITRQTEVVQSGGKIIQETRLWDETKQCTAAMRSKEEAHDYRYFPEPDLVPFTVEADLIATIKRELPESPQNKYQRLLDEYKIAEYDARILIQDRQLADFFETCAKEFGDVKKICNWINGPILKEMNERKLSFNAMNVQTADIITLIKKVDDGTLSNLVAKDVLTYMIDSGKDVATLIAEKGLSQVSDEGALEKIIDEIIGENETVVQQVRTGKTSAVGFLVGQAMKKSQGKANPKVIGDLIKRRLLND